LRIADLQSPAIRNPQSAIRNLETLATGVNSAEDARQGGRLGFSLLTRG
jgi:hypothetical protein